MMLLGLAMVLTIRWLTLLGADDAVGAGNGADDSVGDAAGTPRVLNPRLRRDVCDGADDAVGDAAGARGF